MIHLIQIKAKCEQYWNERRICDEEVHAILEFIHARAGEAQATVEEVKAELYKIRTELVAECGRLQSERDKAEATIERLRATPIGRGLLPPDGISLGELCELRDRVSELERAADEARDAVMGLRKTRERDRAYEVLTAALGSGVKGAGGA